jgi:hypothetical protein
MTDRDTNRLIHLGIASRVKFKKGFAIRRKNNYAFITSVRDIDPTVTGNRNAARSPYAIQPIACQAGLPPLKQELTFRSNFWMRWFQVSAIRTLPLSSNAIPQGSLNVPSAGGN